MYKVILIIVATINPNEKEALNYYLKQMNILYEQVGAQSIGKYIVSESLIGTDSPNLVSIIEFRNKEALEKVFKSEKYKTLKPYREKAFLQVEAHLSKE
ncbi:DUF1330 domain-containing protein [Aquimarina sp. 2-A2]|uniref:DUF1330 domain-containing protein n=1 Tax=Aquimarina sp. 2-A2 TaxID=3382644 RepID=UPI00387F2A0C